MHVRAIRLNRFRRFTDLAVEVPETPRLVVLCGPNGTGKSSLFDALRVWNEINGGAGPAGINSDFEYLAKGEQANFAWQERVKVEFHEDLQSVPDPRERIYYRTAYRNEAEFAMHQISRAGTPLEAPRPPRLIDNDARVSDNYQRLIGQSLDGLYRGGDDTATVRDLRERFIGVLRDAFLRIFPDLELEGPGDPLTGGTFLFRKGTASGFPYKNLSGGEKAVFDLLLDMVVKRPSYTNTVYCIDEPEAHSNTAVQALILDGLLESINETSQLWIATHSIGMLRRARQLQEESPEAVAFLDFGGNDFDQPVTLRPVRVTRAFWSETLSVAVGDLAQLIAPAKVVLCEGRPADGNRDRAEFDARCYRTIFGDAMLDTDFVSVGNAREVQEDELQVGRSIQALVQGTTVIRVVDRDHRSPEEVADLAAAGIRVLTRRHLEAYLLDDEILTALCVARDKPDLTERVLTAKRAAHQASVDRGNDVDDWKSPAGETKDRVRALLQITGGGNSREAFLRDTLAPLISPSTTVYSDLKRDIFG
jgi:predicted ATPase